ncbi:MAG: hypothetical protein ACYTG7_07260 [Planctomycetota bacterium]
MIRMISKLSLLVLLSFTACHSIGPGLLTRDRMDYMEAIADSWKRMMLLNIVKLRYGDAPVFLEVASVINQYALETEVSASASWNAFLPTDSQSVGGKGRYSDRPTITYNPMLGRKFTDSLMKPIPPFKFASLLQSGYSAEFLFLVCVSAINGIYNESNLRLMIRDADPEFEELVQAMTRIQQAGGLGMRLVQESETEATAIFFRKDLTGQLAEDVATVNRLLKLDPEAKEYRITYGSIAANDKEIALLTRSMLQITAEISARVQVPEHHIEENRASPGVYNKPEMEHLVRSRVKIKSNAEKPEDAFVAVKYRDYWFYIEDKDFRSKRMFSFMMFVFTLVESAEPGKGPQITIPTG